MSTRITLFLAIAISMFTIIACANKSTGQKTSKIEVLELEAYKSQLAAEKREHYFVDVRTPEEVADGQIPGATMIDYKNANFKEKAAELDPNKVMYLYCRSGNRSGKASKILVDLGFKEIYDLKGGYNAYSAE